MKFLYKIHSGYDGFSPRRIPERIIRGGLLRLGWDRYIDVLEQGAEVWVFFHGPHAFDNGVYIKGFVQSIDTRRHSVLLRVREYSAERPLTDQETSARVAAVVAPRYRQVFLLPEEWVTEPECTVDSTAASCGARTCETCPTWRSLPLIEPDSLDWPSRLPEEFDAFTPAYWVIPSRCYLGGRVARPYRNTSELFYRFKVGEAALAFPLALGIFEALRHAKLLEFDAIVPIPLSPEKADRGEVHRTRLLAEELARLLGIPVLDVLILRRPCSKRAAQAAGATARQFEDEYYEKLTVRKGTAIPARVLLVDDVCTKGSTLRSARRRLIEVNPECKVVAATAGQMILKEVVRSDRPLLVG